MAGLEDRKDRTWFWLASSRGTVTNLADQALAEYRRLRLAGQLQDFDIRAEALLMLQTHLREAARWIQLYQNPPPVTKRITR